MLKHTFGDEIMTELKHLIAVHQVLIQSGQNCYRTYKTLKFTFGEETMAEFKHL
jgi:hypothetical protein